ncbi:MAG: FxsA family protein [Bacteroidota bacterium]
MQSNLFGRLLLLFLIVPIVELFLLVWLGDRIGLGPTLLLIVVTALLGSFLAQREGLAAWRRFQARVAEGGLPGKELSDGLIILVAGALLLTPGVLTDVVGFLGLLPPTRALLRRSVAARFNKSVKAGRAQFVAFGPGMPPGFDPTSFGRAGAPPFGRGPQQAPREAEPAWRGQPTSAADPASTTESPDFIEDATILDETREGRDA